jgi:hypothetical protein
MDPLDRIDPDRDLPRVVDVQNDVRPGGARAVPDACRAIDLGGSLARALAQMREAGVALVEGPV